MKTHVLILSEYFPVKHPKNGELTKFFEKLYQGKKKHTIRDNYELWKKRIDEVNRGEAVLSIRKWTGKPYRSKQKELWSFDHKAELEVARITAYGEGFEVEHSEGVSVVVPDNVVAKNDGLRYQDFKDWFKESEIKGNALIYLGPFRY